MADDQEEVWWVCCTWYGDDGELYSHGRDGYDAYIRCRDSSHAGIVAREHQQGVCHRGQPSHHASVSVATDICRSTRKGGRSLYKRLGGYDQVNV